MIFQNFCVKMIVFSDIYSIFADGFCLKCSFQRHIGNELAFAISSCPRNVENFNWTIASNKRRRKDKVNAHAIAWAELISTFRQFPRPRGR